MNTVSRITDKKLSNVLVSENKKMHSNIKFSLPFFLTLLLFLLFPTKSFAFAPYEKNFIVTAYYSPLENQNFYLRENYEDEIILNGNGTHGASGKAVFPGMIAAPPNISFGTKIRIPGLGVGLVSDRGGAIVEAGQRGNNYDRLDIWMGAGEEGLYRALTWGKRTVKATVYPPSHSVAINFSFLDLAITPMIPDPKFKVGLYKGKAGPEVKKIQNALQELGFYEGEISAKYDRGTLESVREFQVAEAIIKRKNSFGAGYFGKKTAAMLKKKFIDYQRLKHILKKLKEDVLGWEIKDFSFERDLEFGSSGEDVRQLQKFLKSFGFFEVNPTGIYGKITQKAVLNFQFHTRIVSHNRYQGAGRFGPTTMKRINDLLKIQHDQERKKRERLKKNISDIGTYLKRTLNYGNRGYDVKVLQYAMKRQGFLEEDPTGFFGPKTREAVIKFQTKHRIISSKNSSDAGIFGNQSKKVLIKVL